MPAQNAHERQLELALRADPLLTEQAAADIIELYRAVRAASARRARPYRGPRPAPWAPTGYPGPRTEKSETQRPA
jgi:hypothetical protein